MENTKDLPQIGTKAPDFSLPADNGIEWRLADHRDTVVVLLFYPGNETLVCTRQLCSVRDNWQRYLRTNATIVGISPGTPEEHHEFALKRHLPIPLLADPGRRITRAFAKHWLYPISITRGIVVIDAKGIIRNRDIMLRAFRPSDDHLIRDIYAARGDEMTEKYERLKLRSRIFLRSRERA
ncbi:MAG: redoxin domain-containing protein [Acidobacteriota bacterium]|nr:MAG: redoxin domain-containing protein [Acidobacteriota bacterium]